MAAVGLSDVFKYGTRFLAHLIVVVLLGVVLVLIGNVVGDFLIGTISDPGIRQPPARIGWAGVAIAAAGVLTTVAGLGGLLFKIVADGSAAGTRSALDEDLTLAPAAADDTGTAGADESESTDTAEDSESVPEEPTTQPGQAEDPAPEQGEQHSTDEPTPPAQSGEPERPHPDDPVPPASGEPAPSSPDSDPTPNEQRREEPEPAAARADDEPQEWTPPDPEEFEQHQSTQIEDRSPPQTDAGVSDERSESPRDNRYTDETATEYQGDTKIVDESDIEEPASGATTWEDLQESPGNRDDGGETGTEDPSDADNWTPADQLDQDGTSDSTTESIDETEDTIETEADDENAYSMDEESDDEATYSFETSSDSDPLSDALDEE